MTAQRQDSVTEQLRDVIQLAVEAGCYDAADWIRDRLTPCCPDRGACRHARV